MKIGIIGAGYIGSTLAKHFIDLGHDVIISNSRGPQTLGEVVERYRCNGRYCRRISQCF